MLDTRKIKARMVEMGLTQKDLAMAIGCSEPTISQKLNHVRPITLDEAEKIGNILKLSDEEYYFLCFAL